MVPEQSLYGWLNGRSAIPSALQKGLQFRSAHFLQVSVGEAEFVAHLAGDFQSPLISIHCRDREMVPYEKQVGWDNLAIKQRHRGPGDQGFLGQHVEGWRLTTNNLSHEHLF